MRPWIPRASRRRPRGNGLYGIDISQGGLECSRILTGAPNASILSASNMEAIGNATIDTGVFGCRRTACRGFIAPGRPRNPRAELKPGSKLLLHVVLDAKGWRIKEKWEKRRVPGWSAEAQVTCPASFGPAEPDRMAPSTPRGSHEEDRFTEEQMLSILREADERPMPEVAKKHGVSAPTIYARRKHFGTLDPADIKRLRWSTKPGA